MDTKPENGSTTPAANRIDSSPVLVFLANNSKSVFVPLLIVGMVLMLGGVGVGMSSFTWASWRVVFWMMSFGIVYAAAASFRLTLLGPENLSRETAARADALLIGGATGFVLVIGGLVSAYTWQTDILTWLSPTSEGRELNHLLITAITLFGGLVLMMLSFQVVRTEERSSPVFRRVLYGYNAILNVQLVLIFVVLVTVLVSATVKAPLDFTASKDFSLSEKSIKVLQSLKVPVEVTFIHGFDDEMIESQTETLLKNCQNYTDKLEVKDLFVQQDQAKARSLAKTYPGSLDSGGLLLVYKTPGTDKPEHRIITDRDLVPPPDMMDRNPNRARKFIGEDALMTVLNSLSEDKELPTLYFVQGHGELDPNDMLMSKADTACGVLKRRLESRKSFEIKTLAMDPIKPVVPSKAALVAIIGPRMEFSKQEIKALQDYMAKGGRMLVMLDLVIGGDKKIVKTGLEPLLAQHGVGLSNERIITLPVQFPLAPNEVLGLMNKKYLQQSPLVPPFMNDRFPLSDVRALQSMGEKPGGPFLTMPLMIVGSFSFPDENLAAEPDKIVEDLLRNEEALQKKAREIQTLVKTRGPLAVAVAVTEPDVSDPHAGMAGPSNPKPKMLVIGSASMAANRFMDERFQLPYFFDFLSSAIEWLRGKDQNIGIEAKVNRQLTLSTKSEDEKKRMIFLPLFLVVGSVLGLGCGVWIVRRR